MNFRPRVVAETPTLNPFLPMKTTTLSSFLALCFASFAACNSIAADGGEVIPLWVDGAPGFEDRKDEAEVEEKGSVTNAPACHSSIHAPRRARTAR